jgi:MerR family transcriptional regulator, thiopeptide resistance regulator
MPRANSRTYRTHEFATLAGVTVRELRHYDRIGLLSPPRTRAGYRLYSARDLDALEQIVALKAIGIPLSTIAALRRGGVTAIADAMRAQRKTLEEKRRLLDKAIQAIADVEETLETYNGPNAALFRRIIDIIAMQNDGEDWQAAYKTLIQVWQARRPWLSQDAMAEFGQEWETLVEDVQHALEDDPRGPKAQQLAVRWLRLLRRMYGDDVPVSTWLIAGRNIEKWSPSFGTWPGWSFLSEALAAYPGAV